MTAESVRVGMTGLGGRGAGLLRNCLELEQAKIVAICDAQERHLETATNRITEADDEAPRQFSSHQQMVTEADLDAVIIASPWHLHIPMAIEAMRAGVDAAIEVGPASSVEECWELVRTAEQTGQRCMLLENCCYGSKELALLRMVRNGLFGDLVHCQCGYGHDLRAGLVTGKSSRIKYGEGRDFRGMNHEKRNGDLYPTHGVGPMAQLLEINRGNRFVSLTSTASKAAGLTAWAEEHLPADHPRRDVDWTHGDIITTTIRCANGESLVVTHDVSLPRPYSRMYRVQGTNGLWQDDGDLLYLEDESPDHEWESFEPYEEEWEHSLWTDYRAEGVRAGHGGMDYLMLREFVSHVAIDEPLPIDVYDAAAWMAISPLSEASIGAGSDAVTFPDFTNGRWLVRESTFP